MTKDPLGMRKIRKKKKRKEMGSMSLELLEDTLVEYTNFETVG